MRAKEIQVSLSCNKPGPFLFKFELEDSTGKLCLRWPTSNQRRRFNTRCSNRSCQLVNAFWVLNQSFSHGECWLILGSLFMTTRNITDDLTATNGS
jgi:hypothetical protein